MTAPHASPAGMPRRATPAWWLDAASGVCLLMAAWLWLVPVSAGNIAPSGSADPVASRATVASPSIEVSASDALVLPDASDTLLAVIVGGDIFSPTRRAPSTPFAAPGQRGMTEATESAMAAAVADAGVASADAVPHLSGIVTIGGERRALLQLADSDGAPRLYRVNESHAGYRVMQIGSDHVVLASRSGTRTVRLAKRLPSDSLENLP